MDLPRSLRNLLGNGSSSGADPASDPEEQARRMDGGQIVAEGADQIAIEVPEDSDVNPDQIQAALQGNASSVNVRGQAGGDTTVTPVASGTDIHITDSAFDLSDWEYKAYLDDQITNLMDNRVDYNQPTGQWILANDDLIPGILIRLKSLMLGQGGMEVKPSDPDSEADQRLADHMEQIYAGDQAVEAHVDPGKVIDRILEQNVMNAVFVGRSTDLQHLDVDDLSYVKDGETGEEIYIQGPTSYTTFDISDDGEPTVGYDYKEDSTALKIGQEVVDVRLYRTPPLQAIADDVVNKMQLKRLQGRKAEIASIGGIIIRVNPPAWLSEEDYDQYVAADDDQFGDESGRLLELVMAQQIDAALDTLQDYQTATVMSIPENWETDTIELPEMDESMSDMIRDYNEAISRRLLLPLDLIELKDGPELSRNSMMQMFLDQISGWQGQITDMFDQFAQVQADIHGLGGEVDHSLPKIEAQDEKEILQLFNFAGLLGLSEAEGRELANVLEGVDLDTDQMQGMPQDGGPEDPKEREEQMQEMLDQQQNGQNQGPASGDGGDNPQGDGPDDGMEATDSGITRQEVLASMGVEGDIEAADGDYPMDPDQWPPRAARAAWKNVGQSEASCMAHMVTNAGWDDRKAQAFCSSLQDSLHRDNPLSMFEAAASEGQPVDDVDQIELPTTCRMCDEHTRIQGSFYCPGCHPDIEEDQFDGDLAAALSDQGAIKAGQDGDPICWVCGDEASLVNETPPNEFTCSYHGISPNHVPIEESDVAGSSIEAAGSFDSGDEVDTPSGPGVVVEVRTEDFDGPDGAVEASEDNPAYIVGVESGVKVYRGSDLSDGEIDADVDNPEGKLAAAKAALASDPEEAPAWLMAARGDGRFDYPDSWEDAETPARLILLKAWAGMNGQFDCGGDCCKGTMMKNGMSDAASDRFCASMKDRVMGGWEGWRKGAASASVQASHGFSGFETVREAASHVRGLVDKRIPEGHTTEVRKRKDMDDDAFAVIIRDRDGNFQGSMMVRESETDADQWLVTGGDQFLGGS